MRVLVTGNGKSGSWQIRGQQLGEAIGATVDPNPKTVRGFDLIVLVKKAHHPVVGLRGSVPLVYDIVDAWQQPIGADRSRRAAFDWMRRQLLSIKATGVVVTTEQMGEDMADEGFAGPMLVLPHHARPGLVRNPVRQNVQVIGYEGSEKYLGWWRPVLEDECKKRGWRFEIVRDGDLSKVDIVVAVRDEEGYPAKHWKSNVKLANAQASGTPVVLNRERGYKETESLAEVWADDLPELRSALDYLTPYQVRKERAEILHASSSRVSLDRIARQYRAWLSQFVAEEQAA